MASAANAGLIFVLLQRVAHALGVGEGCAVTASYPEVRSDHHHANSFRTAPSLCADIIFGKDNLYVTATRSIRSTPNRTSSFRTPDSVSIAPRVLSSSGSQADNEPRHRRETSIQSSLKN